MVDAFDKLREQTGSGLSADKPKLEQSVQALELARREHPHATAEELDDQVSLVWRDARRLLTHFFDAQGLIEEMPDAEVEDVATRLEAARDVIPEDAKPEYTKLINEYIGLARGEISLEELV